MSFNLKVEGLEELKRDLEVFTPREARNIMRGYIGDVARFMRDDIKRFTPTGPTGNLKKSIAVKTRARGNEISAEVYNRGRGYHWHLVEFGTQQRTTASGANRGKVKGNSFVTAGIAKTAKEIDKTMPEKFEKRLIKTLQKRQKNV